MKLEDLEVYHLSMEIGEKVWKIVMNWEYFEKDTLKTVYVKNGRKFQQKPVLIGYSGENFAIISEGLKENDVLCLLRPPDKFIIPLEDKKL